MGALSRKPSLSTLLDHAQTELVDVIEAFLVDRLQHELVLSADIPITAFLKTVDDPRTRNVFHSEYKSSILKRVEQRMLYRHGFRCSFNDGEKKLSYTLVQQPSSLPFDCVAMSSMCASELKTYRLILKQHAKDQAKTKKFPLRVLLETFSNPEQVYPSRTYPGQFRVTGNRIVLVGVPDHQSQSFTVITVYQDKVLTPPRPDQLETPLGQQFAQRYYAGLGRAKKQIKAAFLSTLNAESVAKQIHAELIALGFNKLDTQALREYVAQLMTYLLAKGESRLVGTVLRDPKKAVILLNAVTIREGIKALVAAARKQVQERLPPSQHPFIQGTTTPRLPPPPPPPPQLAMIQHPFIQGTTPRLPPPPPQQPVIQHPFIQPLSQPQPQPRPQPRPESLPEPEAPPAVSYGSISLEALDNKKPMATRISSLRQLDDTPNPEHGWQDRLSKHHLKLLHQPLAKNRKSAPPSVAPLPPDLNAAPELAPASRKKFRPAATLQ
ncbi:hypothetical protein HDU78_000772 [Chytriomyces hyalinus]|nr:hypothetical protein HDU78_000772 [Chytriomyces hyalinus]